MQPPVSSRWLQRLTPYLFLMPALVMLTLTVFIPAVQAFYLAFTEYELILTQPPQWVEFQNFERLLKDEVFWQALKNTLLYLAIVVPVLVFIPLLLAILVNKPLKGIKWFRAAYYTPVVISMVVAGLTWKWIYQENGLLNQIGEVLTGQAATTIAETQDALFPIPWLTSPDWALFSVMVVTIWKGLGYYMMIYLAGLQSIPNDLYEAAAIDGSDGWLKHLDITVPLMRPYLLLVGVISAISATKVFEEVLVMTEGGPRQSSTTIVYYVYDLAFKRLEISYACTIGLVLFLIILGLSLLRLAFGGQESIRLSR